MLRNGKYSVWFRTPLGEGTGVVTLKDGMIKGGDTVLAYTGSYRQGRRCFHGRDHHRPTHSGAIVGIRHRQCRSCAHRQIHADGGVVPRNDPASAQHVI